MPRYIAEYMETLPKAINAGVLKKVHGKTQDHIICQCGHHNYFYRWSWAGNGEARCKGCGSYIDYNNLRIWPNKSTKVISNLKKANG